MNECSKCRASIVPGNAFCTQCGTPSPQPARHSVEAESLRRSPLTMGFAKAMASQADTVNNPPRDTGRDSRHSAPSWKDILRNPELRSRVLRALGWSLTINVSLTTLIIGTGVWISTYQPMLGLLWMFLGSFAMMARTYSKPWKLMTVTCLLPAFAASSSYAIQLWLFSERMPQLQWIGIAATVGLIVGLIRARTHEIYYENGQIMARRTAAYLIIWAIAYLGTQLLGMIGATTPLIHSGLLTGAFSTMMLTAVSLVILMKFRHQQQTVLT
ncbi:hypothetical protein KOR42_47620 [Thalassoglobus neptunius]|uniref:Uncharacterized protein n=1 Tax=Thalassoglobus neptunius TaxID=1938619 RepID=A0A5C5VV54_9PLAN|nr:zinc ribbon domain-containing protein [Thalassoglobus neptunius]TWT41491.1 hypothetical protein KOR42_47620 [Thalassoglobus neptunius]